MKEFNLSEKRIGRQSIADLADVIDCYKEEDVKEFIKWLDYFFMLNCSNSKDYNIFKNILKRLAGDKLK